MEELWMGVWVALAINCHSRWKELCTFLQVLERKSGRTCLSSKYLLYFIDNTGEVDDQRRRQCFESQPVVPPVLRPDIRD
eukprot:2826037-Ditylum_brightwellii.AAC.1